MGYKFYSCVVTYYNVEGGLSWEKIKCGAYDLNKLQDKLKQGFGGLIDNIIVLSWTEEKG